MLVENCSQIICREERIVIIKEISIINLKYRFYYCNNKISDRGFGRDCKFY